MAEDLAGDLAQMMRAALADIAVAAPFVALWPEGTGRRAVPPGDLPVCRWLEGMAGPFAAALRAGAGRLSWRQTYGAADFGAAFLQAYGWTEVIGLRGPIPSTRIAAGFLMLGPGVTYPPHAHAAEEVYLPLAGLAEWQRDAGAWREVPPGEAILHPAWVPHAMRTGDQALLALYLWRGGDLAAKSVIL